MTKKCGVCWKHKDKEGKTFLSGNLDLITCKLKIGIFQNDGKKGPKDPDYNICILEDKTGQKQPEIKTEKVQDL